MEIKKIKLNAINARENMLNVEDCLSMRQMMEIVGGYDYTSDSSCFFNCLEYLGKEVYGNKKYQNYDCDTYGNSYVKGHGGYTGSGNYNDYINGPEFMNNDGSVNMDTVQNCEDLIHSYFDNAASGFVTGSQASELFGCGPNEGVIGFIVCSGVAHSVIITGYDSSTGSYSYYDPSIPSQNENQTVKATDVWGVMDCYKKR